MDDGLLEHLAFCAVSSFFVVSAFMVLAAVIEAWLWIKRRLSKK